MGRSPPKKPPKKKSKPRRIRCRGFFMSRIAGGLGGTRHYPISMKGLAPHKRGRRPKPVHSSSDTLSVPASGGYEWLGAPGLIGRAGHRQGSRGSRAKAMGQTVREKALIRQAREDGRPSEDDVAQERLGWRGQKGRPRAAMMTEDSKLQTPPDLDPGHTA